ncbi:hypothetical protein [Pseudonocardia xishanensis]|uniref:Uncharacterized protein n=1 Tax=Pseudonocardia xishanensis TaxID=630995 RepID=A0ABP8RT49_9PSEU
MDLERIVPGRSGRLRRGPRDLDAVRHRVRDNRSNEFGWHGFESWAADAALSRGYVRDATAWLGKALGVPAR